MTLSLNVAQIRELAAHARAIYATEADDRPEWLKAMNSDLREPYYGFLHLLPRQDPGLRRMLEIGTRTGAGALHFAAGHPQASCTTIDIDPAVAPHVGKLAAERGLQVEALTADSSKLWTEAGFLAARRESYDVLLIDGDHTYVSSLGDYKAFRGLVRRGGIILFDDTRLHEGMTRAWAEVEGEKVELPELHYMGFGAAIVAERALAAHELRYRGGEHAKRDLQPGECTIFDNPYRHGNWLMAFRFIRATDGKPETRTIPVNPRGGPTNRDAAIGMTWGLQPIVRSPGQWQISPSVNCLDSVPDPNDASKNIDVEVWHKVPVVVDVPEGEPWQ